MHTTSNALSPIILAFVVRLDTSISRRARQHFFGQMQKALSRRGMLMNWSGGTCLAVSRQPSNWREDRHKVLNWLVDQSEVREVFLVAPLSLRKMLGDGLYLEFESARLRDSFPEVTSWVLEQVLMGLVTRSIMELQNDTGAGHGTRP